MLRLASVLRFLVVVVALLTSGCSSFQLVDRRPAPEREGFPYPNSSFRYTMHGDRSLEVDRLQLLQVRLAERFQHELAGKQVSLQKFFVMEATIRDSFVQDASGKSVPNKGPFEPTLVAELVVFVGEHPFAGFAELKLPQNSRATHAALDKVTKEAIDNMLEEMARYWTRKDDG